MDKKLKKHLIDIMRSDNHRHESMTSMLECSQCGIKMKKAEYIYNEQIKKHPEKIIREKPSYPDSPEVMNKLDMLTERLKNDALYKRHIKLLCQGTEDEKRQERIRASKGYYITHTG